MTSIADRSILSASKVAEPCDRRHEWPPSHERSHPGARTLGGSRMTIRNPVEWSGAQFVNVAHAVKSATVSLHHIQDTIHSPAPTINRIRTTDVWEALLEGFRDFEAYRTDVIFLCVVY